MNPYVDLLFQSTHKSGAVIESDFSDIRTFGKLACRVSSACGHYMSLDWEGDTRPPVGMAFQRI